MTDKRPILVTAGTGKTGRRIVRLLEARGHDVRVGSRTGRPRFDWNDPTSWGGALEGVGAVYVAYYPDLAFPGVPETIGAFVDAAVQRGTTRFVLLSGRGEPGAEASEQALRRVAPHWTILRSSFMMQNLSEHFLLDPVRTGSIEFPAGTVGEPFIDADDLAEAAVAALTDSHHDHHVYELTGPRLLSFHDVAAELAEATGRTVTYRPLTTEEYVDAAVAHGVPEAEVAPLAQLFSEVLDGRNAHVTHDLEAMLGRPARDFREFAAATAATGAWSSASVQTFEGTRR